PPPLDNPFIVNPGNGPRVKDTETFLSSFFCPPVSLSDRNCAQFARDEILTVLYAVLPRELALIVWYNKTRDIDRICPACQRLYRVGDSLVDPISGELVDMNNPETPPQLFREQLLSGMCSFPCFFLASYSSHPYTTEVARGAWGLLYDELHAQTRSLLDATDPSTAAILRYGFAALTPSMTEESKSGSDERGLGRAMRMTRKKDLGLGEVLEALAWYEEEGQRSTMGEQLVDHTGHR
ncbi:uncharacterized protein FOMMEDRAFT_18678, partial [Fomitiporia mediterranea MF3/22]|uniref:uncharacterized protein n=1 Tax=Fomitiporia mediterranea (strain MF3/22) TaxID=694068 RepID=UPI0004409B2E